MRNYVLKRLFKSIISILVVVAVVVAMVYKMVPHKRAFDGDEGYRKLTGNHKVVYTNSRLEQLGYLDYANVAEMCSLESENPVECAKKGSEEFERVLQVFRDKGYTVEKLKNKDELQGSYIAYRFYNVFELIGNFYKRLLVIDHPNFVQDQNNPDMERGYYFGQAYNGLPALLCKGCNYKHQIYLNGKFPFLHSNILHFNFGESFPTQAGVKTTEVISSGQGKLVKIEQTFPTGETINSSIKQETCRYKVSLDHLDQKKFEDHYADCDNYYDSPSMIQTSYIFGVSALVLAYLIGIPFASAMARNKGKFLDKFGIFIINLLVAVPSLALIFFFKYVGLQFGLPDMFPHLGFFDIRSYIMPIIVMSVLSLPTIMIWIRRYMVDQSTADYVKFAKAKGLTRREISRKHVLRNAIIPIVNGLPTSLVLQISGAVITESVFGIPGMGKMLPDSVKAANNNMVITLTFIFTTLAVFAVFLGDILMTRVDPRIRLNESEGGN